MRLCANENLMERAEALERVTVEDYLSGELRSEVRHEFIGGSMYAMAGASEEHNPTALNLAAALHAHLGDGRVFMVDMKVRLHIARDEVFYYPDLMVTCDSRDPNRYFMRHPKVLIEVLSGETERTDRRGEIFSFTRTEKTRDKSLGVRAAPD